MQKTTTIAVVGSVIAIAYGPSSRLLQIPICNSGIVALYRLFYSSLNVFVIVNVSILNGYVNNI